MVPFPSRSNDAIIVMIVLVTVFGLVVMYDTAVAPPRTKRNVSLQKSLWRAHNRGIAPKEALKRIADYHRKRELEQVSDILGVCKLSSY